MMKHLKILLFVTLAVALVSGTALAGSAKVNHGAATTAFKIGVETLGSARNVTITSPVTDGKAATNVALSYTLGQSVAAGSLLNITFSGAQLRGETYSLCAQNNSSNIVDQKIGSITLSSATSGVNIAIDTAVANAVYAAGNFLALVSGAACNGTTASVLNLAIPATASTGTGTVTAFLQTGGTTYDTATAANVATIMNQYSNGTPGTTTHTIDYLAGARNGSQFVGAVNSANTANAVNISSSLVDFGVTQATGITVAAVLSLQDSQNWQGVRRVFVPQETVACLIANNIAANTSPTGTVNFAIAGANINTTSATVANNVVNLCVDVTANVSLSPRTIKGTQDIGVTGTGAQDVAASTEAIYQTWVLNAYQGIVTWLVNSPVVPTFCLIGNTDTARSANVLLDVVSSEGAVLVSGSLGSLAAKSSVLATFTGNSASIVGGIPIDLTTLTADKRYIAKVTVTTNPDIATMTCIQTDPLTGVKRAVPVLSNSTSFKQ